MSRQSFCIIIWSKRIWSERRVFDARWSNTHPVSEAKIRPAAQACSLDFRYRKIEKITVRIENRGFADQPASTIHELNTCDDPREEDSIQQDTRQSYSERRKLLQVELRVTSRRQALPRPSCLVQRITGRESRDQKWSVALYALRCSGWVWAGEG